MLRGGIVVPRNTGEGLVLRTVGGRRCGHRTGSDYPWESAWRRLEGPRAELDALEGEVHLYDEDDDLSSGKMSNITEHEHVAGKAVRIFIIVHSRGCGEVAGLSCGLRKQGSREMNEHANMRTTKPTEKRWYQDRHAKGRSDTHRSR